MKKSILIILFLGFFSFIPDVFAVWWAPENTPYDELQSVPTQFDTAYTYDKGVVICCNKPTDTTCRHMHWVDSAGNHNLNSFTYNPTTHMINLDLAYSGSPPYIYGNSVWPPYLEAFVGYANDFGGFGISDDSTWETACSLIKTSDPSIIMTNTATSQTCTGVNWKILTVVQEPQSGGGVASLDEAETIQCNVNSNNFCQANLPLNSEIELEAYPSGTDYVFAYWDDGTNHIIENPHIFTMSEAMEVTAVFARSLGWPLSGTPESRTILLDFGGDWIESCGGQVMKHTGIDIAATTTDTVYATGDGVVKVAQIDQDWGGLVTIEHNNSSNPYTTAYIHIIPSVSYNDTVSKGDPIGTVVNYGGPVHLHFGLRNGAYTNTSNRGRLPQSVCGDDPAYPENFEDPATFLFE